MHTQISLSNLMERKRELRELELRVEATNEKQHQQLGQWLGKFPRFDCEACYLDEPSTILGVRANQGHWLQKVECIGDAWKFSTIILEHWVIESWQFRKIKPLGTWKSSYSQQYGRTPSEEGNHDIAIEDVEEHC